MVEGDLIELEPGPAGLRRRALATGSRGTVPSGTVHDVLNDSAAPASSIHAYSPPLSGMTFSDHMATRPVRSERVEPVAPVLAATGAWLIPADQALPRR